VALYKYAQYVKVDRDPAFEADQPPGGPAAKAGIYRCIGCGREVVAERGAALPSQSHHAHERGQSEMKWRLAVAAITTPN
jgi:hypothetical protein